jgi:hypothetical protein
MSLNQHYIHELPTGKYRDSTKKEIAAAKIVGDRRKELMKQVCEIEKELRAIDGNCKHLACWDEAGWVWDTRRCLACAHVSHL